MAESLPVPQKKRFLPKIKIADAFVMNYSGKDQFNKMIFSTIGEKCHYTIGFYDKIDYFEVDIHKTYEPSNDKYDPVNNHQSLMKLKIIKERVNKFSETQQEMLKEKIELLMNSMKPILISEIHELDDIIIPLRSQYNQKYLNQKEITINSFEDMREKFGNPIMPNEFDDKIPAAMVLDENKKDWKLILKRNGLYYIFNVEKFAIEYLKIMADVFGDAIIIEIFDKNSNVAKIMTFSDMAKLPRFYNS